MKRISDPKVMQKVHLVLMIVWVVSIIPTWLWWRENIFWVLCISIYANFVSHWSAYQGAKSEEVAQVKEIVEDEVSKKS